MAKGAVSKETKFEYAWCLIRSKYSQDIKKGIVLLEGKSTHCTLCTYNVITFLLANRIVASVVVVFLKICRCIERVYRQKYKHYNYVYIFGIATKKTEQNIIPNISYNVTVVTKIIEMSLDCRLGIGLLMTLFR